MGVWLFKMPCRAPEAGWEVNRFTMWTLLVLCSVIASHGAQGFPWDTYPTTADSASCMNNCGYNFWYCSCSSDCEWRGNCCSDYRDYCTDTTLAEGTSGQPSCLFRCNMNLGSCSCTSSCYYYGNCCPDYEDYCSVASSPEPDTVTPDNSCYGNCGQHMGTCSCISSCEYYGNCCHDYYHSCTTLGTTAATEQPSCRYNCGWDLGSCSCRSSCSYYGNCCDDFSRYCYYPTTEVPMTTEQPSCRYNCGWDLGSCSCRSSCSYYGNCCDDFSRYCHYPTTEVPMTAEQPSCRYNCGWDLGSCSCRSSCSYDGNCCDDFSRYCYYPTTEVPMTTEQPSCRYNCGWDLGSCSCRSSCSYYGNCCDDFSRYCYYPTTEVPMTAEQPSCRYNCGWDLGSCSCRSSCSYYGNCCDDFSRYCYENATEAPTEQPCGGSLFGSGTFSSPNHPYYYNDNAYCVWQLRASFDQTIFLSFTYLQLENCCSCDYISIYDGPSVGSRYLGKVCNNSLSTFHSSSNYMTVLFRTDGSVVGRGFNAEFISSLPPSSGRVDCSSDNMNIVIDRSYLNSLGYDGHSLYLSDPYCRPEVSYYQVVFSFPINTCGNTRQFQNGRVVYTNTIRAYASTSGEITRQSNFKMNVSCRMEPDSVAQIVYMVEDRDNATITGGGRFNTSMDFYTSSSFYYKVTEVPYKVKLNQNLYVQVDLRRGDSSLVLFLDTCVTSPSPHDFQTRSYYLVRNGCPVDNTYVAYSSGTRPYARFRFQSFLFLRASDSVYIQCKVLICQASDYNSRCRQGCNKRVARDLGSEHDSETLVLGPIQLEDPEQNEEETQETQDEA